MKIDRFIFSSCCATTIAVAMLFLLAMLDDAYSPGLPPIIFRSVVLVIDWPLTVSSIMLHHDPPSICFWPLLIFAGLFWGFIVEIIFLLKKVSREIKITYSRT
jgi:hypothetical protein